MEPKVGRWSWVDALGTASFPFVFAAVATETLARGDGWAVKALVFFVAMVCGGGVANGSYCGRQALLRHLKKCESELEEARLDDD
jgi:hypothetical protein